MEPCGHIPVWTGERIERTNARGRHRYCEPFKAWIVEQALKPGMSAAGLAMRNQVNANQLRRWMSLHRVRSGLVPVAHLLPVTVSPEPLRDVAAGLPSPSIAIELGGAVVRVPDGVHPQALRVVLHALRDLTR